MSQGVFTTLDNVDVARDGRQHHYDTNAVIMVGCKVLETGSRVAKGLEFSWKSWTNIGVLIAYLQEVKNNLFQSNFLSLYLIIFCYQNEIIVQNLMFLKQVVPLDPGMFMYVVLVNMRLAGLGDETRVLAGLQKLRG